MELAKRPMWQVTLFVITLVVIAFCLVCGGVLALLTAIGPIVVTLTPAIEGPAPPLPSPTSAPAAVASPSGAP
ncbi:MAG: hypothetical protein JXA93_12260 [Anaerolineae bacterium]|nr:hypothetical protein [Anaerolineae bacterium]